MKISHFIPHILQCADNDHHLANNMNFIFTLKCIKKISYIHAERQYLCLYMIVEILFFSLPFHAVSTTISSFQSCRMHGWKNMEHILFAQEKYSRQKKIFIANFLIHVNFIHSVAKTVENSKKWHKMWKIWILCCFYGMLWSVDSQNVSHHFHLSSNETEKIK